MSALNENFGKIFDPQVSLTLDPRRGFAAAEGSIRKNSKTFFLATALLPAAKRRAIRALYAFCRASDDLIDVQGASLADIERWRTEVRRPTEQQTDPVLYCWALMRQAHHVNPIYEDELISGVASDLQPVVYQSWEQLERYCYLVASTVGLLSIPIVGLRKGVSFEQAAPFAIQLGIALQLTNILRDVGEDAAQGRVYLPQEDLERFGLSREDVLNGVQDERFTTLIKFEIERARWLYRQAIPGIALLSASGQLAVGAAALLYRAILDEIELIAYRVHERRAFTSGKRKLAMLPRVLITVLSLKPPAVRS
jgi:phytoene synthase